MDRPLLMKAPGPRRDVAPMGEVYFAPPDEVGNGASIRGSARCWAAASITAGRSSQYYRLSGPWDDYIAGPVGKAEVALMGRAFRRCSSAAGCGFALIDHLVMQKAPQGNTAKRPGRCREFPSDMEEHEDVRDGLGKQINTEADVVKRNIIVDEINLLGGAPCRHSLQQGGTC